MDDITSIGARLRARRNEIGWTQDQLAEHAGLSADMVGRVERGARRSCRWSTIVAMSQAMDVDPGDLLTKHSQLSATVGDASILRVRNAVYDPALLPGLPSHHDTGEPAARDELWRDVQRAYGAYFAGEFGVLAAELPDLLGRCRASQTATTRAEAAAPYAHAYQLAACLLVHAGKSDAAQAAAERALAAIQDDVDEWRAATMYGTYAWVMLHTGRYRQAEDLVVGVADTIVPAMTPKADPRQLTAWGGLMMHAGVLAAGADRGEEARAYLAAARASGALMGSDRHDYWVSFGPSQVEVQEAHVSTGLEDPDAVLRAHRRVQPGDLLAIQQGRHLLNVAAALRMKRRNGDAERAALRAVDVGGQEWFRHQRFAAAVVSDLEADGTQPSEGVRMLRSALGTAVGGAV